jgi:hypothetical protein
MQPPERPKLTVINGKVRIEVPLSYHPKRPLERSDLRRKFLEGQDRALQQAVESYRAAQPSPRQEN